MSISTRIAPAPGLPAAAGARHSRLAAWGWPLGVLVVALVPRLLGLGSRPFWLDEVFTLNRASLKPGALVLDSFQNHHMPSFFLMLAPFAHFTHPEFWLRLPSALFGAAAVMLVFMIAERIAGRLAGVVAALILAFSPTVLAFAQEARSYTLEMTMILVALYGVTRLALDLPAASGNWRAANAGWLCYVLGTAAALDVLGDGLPWVIAANIIFLGLLAFTPARGRFARNFLLADAGVLLLTAPFYALLLHFQTQTVTDSIAWIPPLNAARLWYNLGAVYLMHVADWVSFRFLNHDAIPGLVWVIDALLLLALGAAGWWLRRRPALLILLGVAFLFLPCLFIVISLWHPLLLPRYLLWSAAPFAVLIGVGAAALLDNRPAWTKQIVVAAAAVMLLANLLPYYHNEVKPRWDLAAQILAADVTPGDVVYLSDGGALPILRVYLPAGEQSAVLGDSDGDLAHAKQALSQGKRVWVVYGHAGQNTGTSRQFYAGVQALGMPKEVQAAGKRITITLYDPTTHLASCTPLGREKGICS